MTLSKLIAILTRVGRRIRAGSCWLFAPVATSVKGALDRNDFRPVIAKMLMLASAAGAGFNMALRDPDVMGAVVILAIAVLSGLLEAISRINLGEAAPPASNRHPDRDPTGEGASKDAEPRP